MLKLYCLHFWIKWGNTQLEYLYLANAEFAGAVSENRGKAKATPQALGTSPQLMGETGAVALAENLHKLENLKRLKFLGVSYHHIGDKGVSVLAKHLNKLPNLEILSLADNLVGEEGVIALLKAIKKLQHFKPLGLGTKELRKLFEKTRKAFEEVVLKGARSS